MKLSSRIAATLMLALACDVSLTQAQVAGDAIESVQIRSIDLESQVLQLYNFGAGTQTLDGWRFCSHDEIDGFDYTSPSGLNGQSIAAGNSLFVHWNNDASDPNAIDISSLGGAAVDDLIANSAGAAVSIGLYRDSSGFNNSTNLVDHIQYSFDGANVGGATPRGGVATSAELWTSGAEWIDVDATATLISLTAGAFPGAGSAHGPLSYSVIPEPTTALLALLGLATLASHRKHRC